MDTIGKRITYIIDQKCGGNRSRFARAVNITPAYAAQLYAGDRTPSDRTIADICREFGVDRIWLETGAGEPFRPVNRNEQIAVVLGQAIGSNATARDRLIRAFCQLPDEMFDHAEKILEEIIANLQKEKE